MGLLGGIQFTGNIYSLIKQIKIIYKFVHKNKLIVRLSKLI